MTARVYAAWSEAVRAWRAGEVTEAEFCDRLFSLASPRFLAALTASLPPQERALWLAHLENSFGHAGKLIAARGATYASGAKSAQEPLPDPALVDAVLALLGKPTGMP